MDPQTPQDLTQQPVPAPTQPTEPIEPVGPTVSEVNSSPDALQQQIASAINKGKNMLVTVGTNPSVDELASAIGMTFLLDKLGKHATAVFSGKIPPAMEFLDPEKTFENTVDSLRDFIIALDKEKADKLRYKVEDDVVRIFITPYKTVIGEKDLQFSQGDFNVDVVIALGVTQQTELDKSITAHGRILHDATVITINAGIVKSTLGSIDWDDSEASSVAEMLVNLTATFGDDLLDEQISTAFLTGIVAETNRFSNEKTSPKVMTMSAQLMAAGANQQLIATNLRQEGMLSESVRVKKPTSHDDDDGEMVLEHGEKKVAETTKSEKNDSKKAVTSKKSKDTEVTNETPLNDMKDSVVPDTSPEAPLDKQPEATLEGSDVQAEVVVQKAPEAVSEQASSEANLVEEKSPPPVAELPLPPFPAAEVVSELPKITPPPSRDAMTKPEFGGTLNASGLEDSEETSQPALDQPQILEHQNEAIISPDVEAARRAVEDASVGAPEQTLEPLMSPQPDQTVLPSLPSSPTSPPVVTSESQDISELPPLPGLDPTALATAQPEPAPMEAFMQPYTPSVPSPEFGQPVSAIGSPPAPSNSGGFESPLPSMDLPPLPPMPGQMNGAMPPLPPMPGQSVDPNAHLQPQTTPEFMQNMPQTQNSWTQAGQDMAQNQAQAAADRQAKIDSKVADFEQAVDRNRELEGLAPLNNPNGSGLPPVPPAPRL